MRTVLLIGLVSINMLFSIPRIEAQNEVEDLNLYYRFPVSIGMEYQGLTSLGSLNGEFTILDIAGELRLPLAANPRLQPLLRTGVLRYDSQDTNNPEKWDHYHLYATLGGAYLNRFVRNFEVGGYVNAGLSQSVFPNVVDSNSVGSLNLLTAAGGTISLIPSYNLAIELHPSVRYLQSFSELDIFDGFMYGLGVSLHFRLGEDPDSSGNIIRSIRFVDADIPPLFSAMQSYYAQNPMGSVTIENTERTDIEQLQIFFNQNGFMDSATLSKELPLLKAGEAVEIPLFAAFNSEVFTTEGITPMSGEVIVKYIKRGRPAEQRYPVRYDLHDKTAISWDDDRKVGAFITPADSALRNYASFIRQSAKEETIKRYNQQVQTAIQTYTALAELGTIYQVDPSSPFTEVQGNPVFIDSVSLPRDTLKRITGDCDDLTVLFNSLMESMGIETGFITVPGHIYPVINTKVASRDYLSVHPDRSMTLVVDGEIWVPLEITLIGNFSFLDAWRKGADLWNSYDKDTERRGFFMTRASQAIYRPVSLRETDLGLQYGESARILSGFKREMNRLADTVISSHEGMAADRGGKGAYNRLGLVYARFGRYQEAERAFNRALAIDPQYLGAIVNLGNIAYLQRDTSSALRLYGRAENLIIEAGATKTPAFQKVLLNISQVHRAADDMESSRNYYARAAEVDPEAVRAFAFLGDPQAGANQRAGNLGGEEILFLEDE